MALLPRVRSTSSFLSSPKENKNKSLLNWNITSLLCVQVARLPTRVRDTTVRISCLDSSRRPKAQEYRTPGIRYPFLTASKWLTLHNSMLRCNICANYPFSSSALIVTREIKQKQTKWWTRNTNAKNFKRTVKMNEWLWYFLIMMLHVVPEQNNCLLESKPRIGVDRNYEMNTTINKSFTRLDHSSFFQWKVHYSRRVRSSLRAPEQQCETAAASVQFSKLVGSTPQNTAVDTTKETRLHSFFTKQNPLNLQTVI